MRGITEESLKALFDDYQHKFLYSQLEKMYEPHAIMNILHMLVDECKELNAWQPIETAPKDKWLIVADASNSSYIGKFVSQYGRWYVDIGIHVVPTHWQELPEDPK